MNIKDIFNNSRMATPKRFQDYVTRPTADILYRFPDFSVTRDCFDINYDKDRLPMKSKAFVHTGSNEVAREIKKIRVGFTVGTTCPAGIFQRGAPYPITTESKVLIKLTL